jgi:apolipoprotein D and lipocalin family protein
MKNRTLFVISRVSFVVLISFFLNACTGAPDKVTAVKDFNVDRYLGSWYEIARLDHSFEKGLSQVSADYSLQADGGIKVINRGYSAENKNWKEAVGKAYFVSDKNKGHLKVSFFGPFYSSYIIFNLDQQHYQYAFISGYNTDYLWLLSRTPSVSKELIDKFTREAQQRGFDTSRLIINNHAS